MYFRPTIMITLPSLVQVLLLSFADLAECGPTPLCYGIDNTMY